MDAPEIDPYAPSVPPGQDELPYDDGEPMESAKHRDQMTLLIDALQRHFAARPDVYVGGNMAVYFSTLQARNNDFRAPDFFVVLDAIPDRERKSWVVWEEGGRTPDVVIELLSASTEREDRGRKMRVYASLKVREYYLYDPDTELLEGYRLDTRGGAMVPMPPRADGELDCAVLGLRLGVASGLYHARTGRWLRWKTAAGEPLPTGDELAVAAESRAAEQTARAAEQTTRAAEQTARAAEQTARAAEQTTRAETAEARAERLAARLRALGIDPEG